MEISSGAPFIQEHERIGPLSIPLHGNRFLPNRIVHILSVFIQLQTSVRILHVCLCNDCRTFKPR